jgi:hypothetical protein
MSLLLEVRDAVKAQFDWIHFASENEAPANAFLADMPKLPDFAISFYQYGGEKPLETMGGIWAEKPRLQIVVRHPLFEEAEEKAYLLWTFLGNTKHLRNATGRPLLHKITSNSSPFELGPDESARQRIAMNFQIMKELG